jgi:hypothetical protein
MLLIITICVSFAQRGPDEMLLEQATSAYTHHDMDTAYKTLRYLCLNYSRTSVTDAGAVMLYTIDLSEGQVSAAEQINADVLDHWPRSDICWQMVDARFRWLVAIAGIQSEEAK